jgi:hypothetical protein
MQEILYFHHAIRSALQTFASEARALRDAVDGPTAPQLEWLVEQHRFIRAVCLAHAESEDEVCVWGGGGQGGCLRLSWGGRGV